MKTINYTPKKYTSEGIQYFLLIFKYKNSLFSHKYVLKGFESQDKINLQLYRYSITGSSYKPVFNKQMYGKLDMDIMVDELLVWFKYEEGIKNITLVKDGYKSWKDLSIGDEVSITDKLEDNPENNCQYTVKTTTLSLNNGGTKWIQCENQLGDEYAFTIYNTDLCETVFYENGKLIESKTKK